MSCLGGAGGLVGGGTVARVIGGAAAAMVGLEAVVVVDGVEPGTEGRDATETAVLVWAVELAVADCGSTVVSEAPELRFPGSPLSFSPSLPAALAVPCDGEAGVSIDTSVAPPAKAEDPAPPSSAELRRAPERLESSVAALSLLGPGSTMAMSSMGSGPASWPELPLTAARTTTKTTSPTSRAAPTTIAL
jgi:hypothetical protein